MTLALGICLLGSIWLVGLRLFNTLSLRTPRNNARVLERVSILIPARNEESVIGACVSSALGQAGLDDFEVIVLDDASTDGTAAALLSITDSKLQVIASHAALPEGWLGKPWACERLGEAATGSVLVFIDADVRLAPHAVVAAVNELRTSGLQLLSPQPRQVADTWLERLIQPLLAWSWQTTLPLWLAERTRWTILSAAIGQFLVVDADAYRAQGGHASVRAEVIDDINLLKAFKRAGFNGVIANGSELAECRMYRTMSELVAGYGKSAWQAFGGPLGSLAVNAAFAFFFIWPLWVLLSPWSAPEERAAASLALVLIWLTRLLSGHSAHDRIWPDALFHPLSGIAFMALNLWSWRLR